MASKMALALVVAAISFASIPCAAAPKAITADQVAAFKPGVANYADVVRAFGRPMTVTTRSDGTTVIAYSVIRDSVKAATFVPVVGLFAGGAKASMSYASFVFGADGVLQSSETSDSKFDCSTRLFAANCSSVTPDAQPAKAAQAAGPKPVAPAASIQPALTPAPVPKKRCGITSPTDPNAVSC